MDSIVKDIKSLDFEDNFVLLWTIIISITVVVLCSLSFVYCRRYCLAENGENGTILGDFKCDDELKTIDIDRVDPHNGSVLVDRGNNDDKIRQRFFIEMFKYSKESTNSKNKSNGIITEEMIFNRSNK